MRAHIIYLRFYFFLNEVWNIMGDWILGENSKGNQNEHMEVNRLLKKYNEEDIPYFRAAFELGRH